jgi:hypothetical protein
MNNTDSLPPDFKETFLLEEFKACRERISKEIDAINTLEITFILATGAIIAFVSTQNIYWFRVGGAVVFVIGAYGFWRYEAHRKIIRIHETYIIEFLEKVALGHKKISELEGMVKYYNDHKSKPISKIGDRSVSGSLKGARFFVWNAMMASAIFSFGLSFYSSDMFGLVKICNC